MTILKRSDVQALVMIVAFGFFAWIFTHEVRFTIISMLAALVGNLSGYLGHWNRRRQSPPQESPPQESPPQ